jgi:hypothetical protein
MLRDVRNLVRAGFLQPISGIGAAETAPHRNVGRNGWL